MAVTALFSRAQISVLIINTVLICNASDVLYSSLNKMLPLIDTEEIMINTLEQYIQAENQKLESLKKCIEIREDRQNPTMDSDEFASNPLAVFSMIKYLTTDFEELQKLMAKTSYASTISAMSQQSGIVLPSLTDFHGVILKLVNLQRVYHLKVNDLMNGNILDRSFNSTLSVDDCIEIGKACSKYKEHNIAVDWLGTSVPLISADNISEITMLWNSLTESYLYLGCVQLCKEYNYSAEYKLLLNLGDKEYALTCAGNSLSLTWNDPRIQELKRLLSTDLNKLKDWDTIEDTSYKVCRGDFLDDMLERNLKCRYNHSNSAFLILAPLKEEELSINPKIVMYREVIYDSEIELLKSESRSLLSPAEVINDDGVTFRADTQYRPSQTAFIDILQPQFWNLSYRLLDFIGLSFDYAELLQILNYAPGGYYRVHRDNLKDDSDSVKKQGQRVATALLYLNDVPIGGGTALPELELLVQPVKGSAVFWINVLEDGSVQTKVTHAACPVVYGEKWACTQWFREMGQAEWYSPEFRDKLFGWNPSTPAEFSKFWRR